VGKRFDPFRNPGKTERYKTVPYNDRPSQAIGAGPLVIKPEFPILTKNSDFNEDKAVLKDTKIKFKALLCRETIALTEKEKVFLQRNRPVATTKNDL